MEIKAKCVMDRETVKKFARQSLYKRKEPKKGMIGFCIMAVILIAITVAALIILTDEIYAYMLPIELLLFLVMCYIFFVYPTITYNSLGKLKNVTNEYRFCDDRLFVNSVSDEYNGKSEIKYTLIVKVTETKEYFYIYQTNRQAYVVDKSSIEDNATAELRNKLLQYDNIKYTKIGKDF